MGMFDSIKVLCPWCNSENLLQSKGGDCFLETYSLDTAPQDVLSDINRHAPHKCKSCNKGFDVQLKATVIPRDDR